jgi:hypothetical protein
MTIIFIKKIIQLRPNKLLMCLILDIGIEKEFPEQLHLYRIEKDQGIVTTEEYRI